VVVDAMKVNVKLMIQYDGTDFNGWQIQAGQASSRTVQNEIKRAIETIVKEPVILLGAGRTDAGVHARGQVANFVTSRPIPEDRWTAALNSILPCDIRITSAKEVSLDFHAQYSAVKKTYCYYILNSDYADVFLRRFSLHCSRKLDFDRMNQAAASLVGTRDFRAFCAAGSEVKNYERTVYEAEFFPQGELMVFRISANGFLYKMVRSIVGTLLEVGSGKRNPQCIETILQSRDRREAGPTAPPQGLVLEKVWYP